jgi:hypothetical protein
MTSSEGVSENETSPADRDFAGPSKNRTISGAIRGVFRAAVKAITRRDEDESPRPRRRSGETDKAFIMAARATFRRAVAIPIEAYAAATAFLADTLDWLNLWQDNAESADQLDNETNNPDTNHTSLHL